MGRGIALQSSMGRAMATYIASGDPAALPLPPSRLKPLPFHGLNKVYFAAFVAWYRFLDQRGEKAAA
jgi:hypothetical protein